MPNLQIRGLGSTGVIKDLPPSALGTTSWSDASNIRFLGGKAYQSEAFKTLLAVPSPFVDVAGIATMHSSYEGLDTIYVFDSWGRSGLVIPKSTATSTDPSGFTPISGSQQFTSCTLGDILYVNRDDLGIRYIDAQNTTFTALPNTTTGTTGVASEAWTCGVLRAYQDFLIGLSVTRGGETFETMVKWSDATLEAQVPTNWDYTLVDNAESLSGENVLAGMNGPILDGMTLKNDFIIYGRDEVWVAEYTGSYVDVFTFRRIFGSGGIIGRNCAVEAAGLHYVFGRNELYRHDGVTIDHCGKNKVSEFVYNDMQPGTEGSCFVLHNPAHSEVWFCYVSSTGIYSGKGCNKAAVFNYSGAEWTFFDLPNATCGVIATASAFNSWASGPGTLWSDDAAGLWSDDEGTYTPLLQLGLAPTTSSLGVTVGTLVVLDKIVGGVYSAGPTPGLNSTSSIERVGLDFSADQGSDAQLTQAKVLRAIYPQITATSPVSVYIGATMLPDQAVTYGPPVSFNPTTDYKINTRVSGRYLAIKVEAQTVTPFALTGFDLDLLMAGKR